MSRLLREPLLHFLLIGAGLFVLFSFVNPGDEIREADDQIIVSEGRIAQLSSIFEKTWQRPPSKKELEGLIDDFILEEIYYRQAIEMGIDRDDTIIRRRLRQKVEFLTDDAASLVQPEEAELESFLAESADRFRKDSTYTFRQVYISPDKHGDGLDAHIEAQLEALRDGEDVIGDSGLIDPAFKDESARGVDSTFGRNFSDELDKLELGKWLGPVRSGLGFHLIKLDARNPGEVPALADVRIAVEREWANEKRIETRKAVNEKLRAEYEIVIEWPEESAEAEEAAEG